MWCQPDGSPLSHRNEAHKLKRLFEAAEIEPRTPHEIRHTTASLLIADGASIVQVSAQLRHANPSITLKTYSHLFPKDLRPVFQPKVVTRAA